MIHFLNQATIYLFIIELPYKVMTHNYKIPILSRYAISRA